MYPEDLKYTRTHEWVRKEKSAAGVTLGISDYAVKQLIDIVFIELPGAGDTIKKGSSLGNIESVKAVFDLNSPLTAQVTEVNQELVDNLNLLSSDPYGRGWLVKAKLENEDELKDLMSAADYEVFISQENSSLRSS